MEGGLATEDPVTGSLLVDVHVLLLPATHRLVAPLGDRRGGLELDGVPGGGSQKEITSYRYSLLTIPTPDEGPGSVSMVPDGVSVHRPGDALGAHLSQSVGQDLIPRQPGLHLLHHDVLEAVGVP
jgi:hypothetical protein